MRTAIVHYWLTGMRGGEKVLENLVQLFPSADIYAHVIDRDALSPLLREQHLEETFIGRLPLAKRLYQAYLPLMPLALELLDLQDYDLIISSESAPAKGIIPSPTARHICYCHTPMRYLWDEQHQYTRDLGVIKRAAWQMISHGMRQWDVTSAARVDHFVANSHFVAQRIQRYYRRHAEVLSPPVALSKFSPSPTHDDYYLVAGQLTGYKRVDLALDAFRGMDRRLVVAGGGEQLRKFRETAPRNVQILGRVSDAEMGRLLRNCRALIFPGREDFGIVPLEAMACGRPVIAYRAGGALDTVVHGRTGVMFDRQTPKALRQAVMDFEVMEARFDPALIAAHVQRFSEEAFRSQFADIVDRVLGCDLLTAAPTPVDLEIRRGIA